MDSSEHSWVLMSSSCSACISRTMCHIARAERIAHLYYIIWWGYSTRWAKRNGNTAQPQEIEMSERLWGTGMRHCCCGSSNTLSQAVGLTGNVIVMWQIPIIIQKSESVCFSHICSSSVDEWLYVGRGSCTEELFQSQISVQSSLETKARRFYTTVSACT